MNSSAFSKRISQLKNRMEFIRENDPEMAQLFEELISAEIQAKRAFHNKGNLYNNNSVMIFKN